MEIVTLQPVVALIAGVLILVMPRLLSLIVAGYLIVVGLTGLLAANGGHLGIFTAGAGG